MTTINPETGNITTTDIHTFTDIGTAWMTICGGIEHEDYLDTFQNDDGTYDFEELGADVYYSVYKHIGAFAEDGSGFTWFRSAFDYYEDERYWTAISEYYANETQK